MSGKPKIGIDYAGWSVNMFDGDRKIDKLLDAQGWKGFGVYFYLCQSAYKLNGYFLEWCYDDCATTARRMGGFMGADAVKSAVELCLLVGLFDQGLFDGWGVLTSKGMQKRFWAVASGRRTVPLYKELWLLPPEEAEGLGSRARFDNLSPTNGHLQPTNGHLQPTNGPEVKESKVKGIERERAREDAEDADFETFWSAYPRKSAIAEAFKAWLAVSDARPPVDEMIAAVERQKRSTQWTDAGGKYIPSPARWLRQHGWLNQEPEVQTGLESPSGPQRRKSLTFMDIPDDLITGGGK